MTPARSAEATSDTSYESLRDEAIESLDQLIQILAEARDGVAAYQSSLEMARAHLAAGGRASDVNGLFDVPSRRKAFSAQLDRIELDMARVAHWRVQIEEGMTIADIARMWGLSRQLVSRTLATGPSRSPQE